jgi:hypothetical protein
LKPQKVQKLEIFEASVATEEVLKDPISEPSDDKEKPANANYDAEIRELRAKVNELIETVNLLIPKQKRPRR